MESNEVENKAVQEQEEPKKKSKPVVRKKKPIEDIKSKMITCRITNNQFDVLKKCNVKTRDMFQGYLDGSVPIYTDTIEMRDSKKEQVRLLANIANNMNQIALVLNTMKNNGYKIEGIEKYGDSSSADIIIKIIEILGYIRKDLKECFTK